MTLKKDWVDQKNGPTHLGLPPQEFPKPPLAGNWATPRGIAAQNYAIFFGFNIPHRLTRLDNKPAKLALFCNRKRGLPRYHPQNPDQL
jgi:hypothetical protein